MNMEQQEVTIVIELEKHRMKSTINLKQLESNIEGIASNLLAQKLTEQISSILGYKVEITKK